MRVLGQASAVDQVAWPGRYAAARASWKSAVPAKVGQRRARVLSSLRSSLVMRAEPVDRAVPMQRSPRDTARSGSGHPDAVHHE
jgi:hypothetical protein